MRLIIAEKPSLARAIAAGFPAGAVRGNTAIKVPGNTAITWCYGHMYELAPPHDYRPEWKKWDMGTLPITIPEKDWKLLPREDAKAQLSAIASLLRDTKLVVNAGDPDREGQMLVDELLDMLGWKGPTERLLIYDTTPASMRKALASLRPNSEFANLYAAAKCRSRADWLVGMNMTRAVTKMTGVTTHIGRVQTPTLALVVRRDLAIESFVGKGYYTLTATASTADSTLDLIHGPAEAAGGDGGEGGRITSEAEAKRIAGALKGQVVTLSATAKEIVEAAPLPFMLGTYQAAAEKRYGWPVAKALEALQLAYEAQLVSYPRTSCEYLPEEQASRALPIARRVIDTGGDFARFAPAVDLMAPSARVYDDKKVEQHHGLTPTGVPRPDTDKRAVQAWVLVAERFLQSLLPAYKAEVREASFTFEGRVFRASGEQPHNAAESWRIIEPKLGRDKKPVRPLPLRLAPGQSGPARVGKVAVAAKKTEPPKPYTEATLLADMGAVHKFVDDPKLRALLKENAGIGTAATQGATIETLKARKYLEVVAGGRGKKYLRSTKHARYLVKHVPAVLCDPGVTALWEEQLDQVAKGQAPAAGFMAGIDGYVRATIAAVRATRFPQDG